MTAAPVNPGDVLAGKYRVERVLGAGAMGVVIQAMHTQLDERVALKFLRPEALANEGLVARFTREARLAVKLRSEHVAKVLDVGTLDDGAPYIVMEYLQGEDLTQMLRRDGPMEISVIAEYVIQACAAVAEAHAMGIVHRDLKPANLFLTRRLDGTPLIKVLDFGISKATALNDPNLGMTKTASILGSPYYMSPEQMKSAKDVDARSDIWSVGVILYQLLTARLPFESDTLGGLMAKVLQEDPVALTSYRHDIPPQMASIIARCLQRDPRYRAANVAEIAIALAPYAPPRAHPLVERIVSLVGGAPAPGAAPENRMPSIPNLGTFPGDAGRTSSPSQAGSHAGLARSAPGPLPERAPARRGWLILGASLLLVGIAVVIVFATQGEKASARLAAPTAVAASSDHVATTPAAAIETAKAVDSVAAPEAHAAVAPPETSSAAREAGAPPPPPTVTNPPQGKTGKLPGTGANKRPKTGPVDDGI